MQVKKMTFLSSFSPFKKINFLQVPNGHRTPMEKNKATLYAHTTLTLRMLHLVPT